MPNPENPEVFTAGEYAATLQTALARSCMGGKKTAFFKAACSEEMKEALARKLAIMRAETGRTVSESEYIERVVAISLFGYEHVAMVEAEQLRRLAGSWSNLGQGPAA